MKNNENLKEIYTWCSNSCYRQPGCHSTIKIGRRRSAIFTGQNNSSEDLPRYKIVVVGDGGVGKSCLTIQYFQRLFVTEYDPTIEDSYIQHTQVDNEWCLLDVLDTAGQDEFSAMGEQYMRTGDGFMLVYSVTDSQSFENIQNFHIQILQVKDGETCPILLVANKVDLVHFRKITVEAGKELATKIGAGYIETSAKDPPLNVDAAFHEIIRLVRLYLQKKVEEERKKACFPKCTIL